MEFTGRLAAFPAANLLQWAATERASGTLVVRRSEREKRLEFLDGRLVACRSNQPQELYGQQLLAHGHLSVERLAPALTLARARRVPLGVALIAQGVLDETTVRDTLARSIQESVQDLFLWTHGLFFFVDDKPSSPDLAVEISIQEVVLEGTRWMDELERIRGVLVDDGVIVQPGPRADGVEGPYERRLVEASAPESSLADLHVRVGGVHFPFLDACHRLVEAGALEIVRKGPVSSQSSVEIDLRELLLGIESGEEVVVGAGSAILPIAFVEGWVPIWIKRLDADEIERMPAAQRAFLEGIDGRTTLRRLLSSVPEVREDQMELLLVEIQKRNVLLLPAALEEVERRLDEGSPLRRLTRRLRRRDG